VPGRRPWTLVPGGLLLSVRVTPKGGRDAIDGIAQLADGRAVLKARVRAAPSEGEANAAVGKLIAKALDIAPRDVSLDAGATARIKTLRISGDGPTLIAALEKLAATR
jgi:uncharacterized protein (TIGR00251 family)